MHSIKLFALEASQQGLRHLDFIPDPQVALQEDHSCQKLHWHIGMFSHMHCTTPTYCDSINMHNILVHVKQNLENMSGWFKNGFDFNVVFSDLMSFFIQQNSFYISIDNFYHFFFPNIFTLPCNTRSINLPLRLVSLPSKQGILMNLSAWSFDLKASKAQYYCYIGETLLYPYAINYVWNAK